MAMSRLSAILVVSGLLAVVALLGASIMLLQPRQPTDAAGHPMTRVVRAFDEPDEAAAYYAARRRPLTGDIDPRERYRTALGRLRRMPRFATRGNRRLPSLQDAGASAAPVVWLPGPHAESRDASVAAAAAWTPLGPGNIGGRTRVLQIDPRHPDRMLTGGVSGGIWKTDDAGASWRPVGDELANLAVNSMAMSPANPNVIHVGTGEGYFREDVRYTGLPLRGGGIFLTSDFGDHWSLLPATENADFHFVNDLVVSHVDDRVVYAATRTGVWRSPNRGATLGAHPGHDRPRRLSRPGAAHRPARRRAVRVLRHVRAGDRLSVAATRGARPPSCPCCPIRAWGAPALAIAPGNQDVVYALAASNLPGPGGLYEQGAARACSDRRPAGDPGSWTAQVRNTDPVKLRTLILTNPIAACAPTAAWRSANSLHADGVVRGVGGRRSGRSGHRVGRRGGLVPLRDGGRTWGIVSEWWREGVPGFVHADQHGLVFHPDYNGTTNQQAFALTDGGRLPHRQRARRRGAPRRATRRRSSVTWTFAQSQLRHHAVLPRAAASRTAPGISAARRTTAR